MSSLIVDDAKFIRRIESLEDRLDLLLPSVTQSVAGIVAGLQTQQDNLETAQQTLASTVSNLAAAQTAITALVSSQIKVVSFQASASGMAIPASGGPWPPLVTADVQIEDGYDRAIIVATGYVTVKQTVSGTNLFEAWMGGSIGSFPWQALAQNVSSPNRATLTPAYIGEGAVPQVGTIGILVYADAGAGGSPANADNSAGVAGTVIFYGKTS